MKNYLKNLSLKDKILLAGTLVILCIIGGVLIYNSNNPVTPQSNGAVEEPLQLHEVSDELPLSEDIKDE